MLRIARYPLMRKDIFVQECDATAAECGFAAGHPKLLIPLLAYRHPLHS
jgi:hypothetical protein